MPATTLVCPHCEKTVEIQISSVTRSRPCPECGQMVMLQMAEKSTKTKRRALLMSQGDASSSAESSNEETPTTSSMRRPDLSDGPQPLAGDAFDRMRMDPEVHQFRRRLVIGVGVVVFIVIVLISLSIYQSSLEKKARKELFGAEHVERGIDDEGKENGGTAPAVLPADLSPPPVSPGNLVFRAPGSSQLQTAEVKKGDEASRAASLMRLAAAEEVLRKFLDATDWKERALYVRHTLRTAPLMNVYYSNNADGPLVYDSIVETRETSPQFSEHVVVFQGGGRRLATVEQTVDGARVDWESFVGAGEMAWSEFLSSRAAKPTLFRVLVSPAYHFENSFGDPRTLKCYSLRNISEPGAKVVYGYVDKSNALTREIDYWLQQSGDETVPMILRLKFPADAPADFQAWIHQFVQPGWVEK